MGRYLKYKLLELLASLLLLATLTFFLLKILPGSPFDEDVLLHPSIQTALEKKWNLHASVGDQFIAYIGQILQGDLGVSMSRPDISVVGLISQKMQVTLGLSAASLIFVVLGSLVLSLLSLYWRKRWISAWIDQFVILCLALPGLFWGPLLIYFFGIYWDLLPVAFLTTPAHYILPLLTLSLRPLAALTRILKNSMQENLHLDYVRTARAKGLSDWHVLVFHIFRNSFVPYLSYLGPLLVSLFSGSILVELLFALPGLGSEFISALTERDYTVILGLTLFYGFFLIVVSSLVELLLKWTDPRRKEEGLQ